MKRVKDRLVSSARKSNGCYLRQAEAEVSPQGGVCVCVCESLICGAEHLQCFHSCLDPDKIIQQPTSIRPDEPTASPSELFLLSKTFSSPLVSSHQGCLLRQASLLLLLIVRVLTLTLSNKLQRSTTRPAAFVFELSDTAKTILPLYSVFF